MLHAHLVFVTKYRHRVFSDQHLTRMEQIMRDVCADFECELIEFNGEANHVHLLVNFPPKVALSRLVNSLKGVSSRRMRQEFPELVRHYWQAKRCGRVPTSPDRSAVHQFPFSASTSSSTNARFRARSGLGSPPTWTFTTALKGGALAHTR
ncbi:hypothetical protein NRB20_60400 [Nocardia sp. RB20]|uniref:Transposase IS200-like domain-containing protein n=1 Tax=Nocardia macrotermitis TaxID=2585198 RepID=A0A7K0DAV7_9NOCA|nr:hypothetical protein [Nocardia macrotermitis]